MMPKKDLLALPMLLATDEMMQVVENDAGTPYTDRRWDGSTRDFTIHKYYQYLRAGLHDQGNILEVDMFSRKNMEDGDREPVFRIFLNKAENKYLTYDMENDKWPTAKICNLQMHWEEGWRYNRKQWSRQEDENLVSEWCGKHNETIMNAVMKWQGQMRHRSELMDIDSWMQQVPEIPEEMKEWVVKEGFWNDQYMFYQYGRKIEHGYCTAHEGWVELDERPYHNKEYICPVCGRKVMAKSWKKQTSIADQKEIGLLQKLTTGAGYVLRIFYTKIKREQVRLYQTDCPGMWEEKRVLIDRNFVPYRLFVWDDFKMTHIQRWCNGDANYWGLNRDAVLYNGNLDEVLGDIEELKYMPLKEMFRPGIYSDVANVIRGMIKQPKIEVLLKAGMHTAAVEAAKGNTDYNFRESSAWKMMGIRKEEMALARKLDIGRRGISILKKGYEYNFIPTEEEFRFMKRYLDPRMMDVLFRFGKCKRVIRYLMEDLEGKVNIIGDYVDYFKDMQYLEMNPDKSMLFPKNLQSIHMEVAAMRQDKEDAIRALEVKGKEKLMKRMHKQLQMLYGVETEDLFVKIPIKKREFTIEGQQNHNCVGGSYFDKMAEGKTVVFFLRKKEAPKDSYCTVEMKGDRVIQCRSVSNGDAPPEAKAFMKLVQKNYKEQMAKLAKEKKHGICAAYA